MEKSTGQGTLAMLCTEKVIVGLALHQPSVTSAYRLNSLRRGDEHPSYTPVRCIALYTILTLFSAKLFTENIFQCPIFQ